MSMEAGPYHSVEIAFLHTRVFPLIFYSRVDFPGYTRTFFMHAYNIKDVMCAYVYISARHRAQIYNVTPRILPE